MKKILTIFSVFLLFASCGQKDGKSIEKVIENGDLTAIRAKRSEIVAEQQTIADKLKQLDEAIASLDSIKKLPLVTTIQAKDTLFNHYLELQGSVETKKNIVLYPETSGTLLKVFVKEGQRVSKGQTLARIDDGGLSQQVAQMEVQAELAKTTYERQKKLWEQKIGSEIQYLQAKTTYESSKNGVDQMKRQLARSVVTAPFSGIVDDVIAEQGSVVAPGQTELIRIVNLNDMYIEIEVPETYISSIVKGKEAKVHFPILGTTIDTKIRQVGNYINPNNRSFTVEVSVPNKDGIIKPNLTAKVKINDYTSEKAILIPQSIISENSEGDQYAYVTSGKDAKNIAEAKRTIVKTGKTQGDYIEILEGITNGDDIISEGARSVKDGQKVEIIN
ncbi:efflux RND transporter periplasmic adaptor subunit [Aquimarina sp. MMG015]|uniref:efflux RND transporter periplasmic adaptor subunit n=1 Tax=unclassified Aquimarina TaxID=2627091 RepID=UPI000E5202AA|nr:MULTISPECIES: efflux RND transporter periplasmic adaptor subunit [unclassified Aquimarina]AXT57702.1 efflux RND transporter periplasmic adaptor subunit [Aquimarina sp. AD1]MBQ4805496.1 efflux RND transporter periplasmic adaptor subunit [Aquimarina sp. MMG015]RKN37045.1 efflux RND transporter periplasmic adaptor subunit [Aquimarina sp. AD1]